MDTTKARAFYDRRLNEDFEIGSVQLMQEFANEQTSERDTTIEKLREALREIGADNDIDCYACKHNNVLASHALKETEQ